MSIRFSEFTLSIRVIMNYNPGRSNLWKGTHPFCRGQSRHMRIGEEYD